MLVIKVLILIYNSELRQLKRAVRLISTKQQLGTSLSPRRSRFDSRTILCDLCGKSGTGSGFVIRQSKLWFPSVRVMPPNIRIRIPLIYFRLIKHSCLSLQRYIKAVHMDRISVDKGKVSYASDSSIQGRLPIQRVYILHAIFSSFTLSFPSIISFYLLSVSSSRSTRSLSKNVQVKCSSF